MLLVRKENSLDTLSYSLLDQGTAPSDIDLIERGNPVLSPQKRETNRLEILQQECLRVLESGIYESKAPASTRVSHHSHQGMWREEMVSDGLHEVSGARCGAIRQKGHVFENQAHARASQPFREREATVHELSEKIAQGHGGNAPDLAVKEITSLPGCCGRAALSPQKSVVMSRYIYFDQRLPKSVDCSLLAEDTQKLLGYFWWRMSTDEYFKRYGWISVSRDILRSVVGGNYKSAVDEAESAGIIEPFVTSTGVQYSKQKRFCKKYRFTELYERERKKRQFQIIRSRQGRIIFNRLHQKRKNLGKSLSQPKDVRDADSADPVNPVLAKLALSYNNVTLSDTWQDELWSSGNNSFLADKTETLASHHYWGDHIWARQISTGSVKIKQSKSGRVTHPLILMRKKMRTFVKYNDRELVFIDVKSAHPFFLAVHIKNPNELQSWLAICRDDIYARFVTGKYSREYVKKQFQIAISFSPRGKSQVAQAIVALIGTKAPSIYAWLQERWKNCALMGKEYNTVQFYLQQLESEIFVRRGFFELACWSLPMHDGLAVEPQYLDSALAHLRAISQEILGFDLEFVISA